MEALKASPLWDPLDKLSAWRDHLTPERISEALAAVFLPPHFLAREELLHAEWPEIVASVYTGHRRLEEQQ